MERHVTALGALFVAFGLMGLLGMFVVGFIFIGGGLLGGLLIPEQGLAGLSGVVTVAFGLFLTFIIAITTVPSLIAGYGLLVRRSWAPALALIVGIVNLAAFPVGTVMGVYAIWVFVQDDTARLMVSSEDPHSHGVAVVG